jgi:hypothetical protein
MSLYSLYCFLFLYFQTVPDLRGAIGEVSMGLLQNRNKIHGFYWDIFTGRVLHVFIAPGPPQLVFNQKPSCLYLALSIGPNRIGFTWRRGQNPVSEMLCFRYKQDGFWLKTRRWIMSKNIILVLMYHHHKLLDLISVTDWFMSHHWFWYCK